MATGGLLDGTSRLSRDGRPVFHYSFLSSFAERAVVPAGCCVPIPEGVPFAVAALVGCAVTTGTGAVWRTAGVRPGERVCVFGCGGVGMSAVMGAVAAGAGQVVAVDTDDRKLEVALSLGATDGVRWTTGPEETAERVDVGERWRGGLRLRGHRPYRGGSGGVPVGPSRAGRPC